MDSFKPILEFMTDQTFSIPLGEFLLFIVLNSIFILLGRHKMGLLVTYIFVLYWGYVFNASYFMDMLGNTTWGMPIYIFSGVAMVILVILGFFLGSKS
jgi:hypothetical protein